MFLQAAQSGDNNRRLNFSGKKTCAINALYQVAKDNADNGESGVEISPQMFYMYKFLKSVRNIQEEIEINENVEKLLSMSGFKQTSD